MGIFDFLKGEKKGNKSKYFDVDYEELLSFERELDSLSDPDDNLYDYPYWYSFIKQRATSGWSDKTNKSEDQFVQELVFGHSDEYSKRFLTETLEEKSFFIQPRIICYGAIHDLIIELKNKIQNEYPNDHTLINRLHNEYLHSKASLYGAIKFAIINNIKKEQIKKWYSNFNDDQSLIQGDSPIQEVLEKYLIGDEEDRMVNRYEIYELNESEKQEIPFWFRKGTFLYGYFKKGREVTNKANNKSIKLNRLERSLYWNFKCLSSFVENLPEKMNNHELYIEIYETNELIKNYFEEQNSEAYSILIKEL
jgi:hypothetical protein